MKLKFLNIEYNWYDSDLIYANTIPFPLELYEKCRNNPGSIIQKGFIAELGSSYFSIGKTLYIWNNFHTLLGKDDTHYIEKSYEMENEIVQVFFYKI